MRVVNEQCVSNRSQRSVGCVEKQVCTHIVLRSDPFSFQYPPKCFRNIQVWRIWRQIERKSPKQSHTLSWISLYFFTRIIILNVERFMHFTRIIILNVEKFLLFTWFIILNVERFMFFTRFIILNVEKFMLFTRIIIHKVETLHIISDKVIRF